jgi:hypothetical protein
VWHFELKRLCVVGVLVVSARRFEFVAGFESGLENCSIGGLRFGG